MFFVAQICYKRMAAKKIVIPYLFCNELSLPELKVIGFIKKIRNPVGKSSLMQLQIENEDYFGSNIITEISHLHFREECSSHKNSESMVSG